MDWLSKQELFEEHKSSTTVLKKAEIPRPKNNSKTSTEGCFQKNGWKNEVTITLTNIKKNTVFTGCSVVPSNLKNIIVVDHIKVPTKA